MTLSPWQWVDLLYQGVTPPHGYAEFRLLDPHPENPGKSLVDRLWMEWVSPEELAPKIPRKKWLKGHVYLGVALRTPDGQASNSGTRHDTHPTHLVWVDVDLKHTVYLDGQTNPEELSPAELRAAAQACLDDLLTTCEEHGLPPRAVVYSGQGLQLYWARRARSSFEDTEAFNRGLAKLLDGDPASTDQARILRVPGWEHHKNPDRPLPVELWHQDPAAWVDDTVLEAFALRQLVTTRTGDVTVNQGSVSEHDLDVLREAWLDVNGTSWGGNGRHQLALWVGGWLRSNGYSEGDATELVRELAMNGNDPGLQDRLRAVRDAYKTENPKGWTGLTQELHLKLDGIPLKEGPKPNLKGAGTGTPAAATATAPAAGKTRTRQEKTTLTEYGRIFLEYSHEHRHEYAYHERWQKWFEYQGGVYTDVLDSTMRKRVDLVMQERGEEDFKKSDLTEILLKVAHTPGVGKTDVDQSSWELNCANGILDLRTLELSEHSPEYFSVVQTGADWNPNATSDEWRDFLTAAVPSREDRETLQRYCGYCLTGDTSAQKALLLIGQGGTGKSTFADVVAAALGGMGGHSLATSSALENIKDGSFIVGNLVGKRMCIVSELQERVDWLPFKRITGEDPISVDVKNKDSYVTKLDTKLIILSNVRPNLGEDTSNSSLMRRFLPVAFNIKPAAPDPGLKARLTSPESLSGVLTWMVRGLRTLLADQMRFPNTGMNELAREIVEDSNRCIDFLRECCAPTGSTGSQALYDAYKEWSLNTGRSLIGIKRFTRDLPAAVAHFGRTTELVKTRTGNVWPGVMLSTLPGGWEDVE
ncbi:phage/plasmid primase, P4 family [Deinococcus ruber]|uniref:SF3 helicase domain-containing protein n=1 Tax=Deinococcus ruber TaxID=1848197 RepID=A0A918F4B9_9DEIO|nr:phage/plasmid primase, P4 family [Deinococcus ruber]GGR00129.1 hypothetical protein GCM10008957_11060 [Deinococcus ruber]